MKPEEMTVTIPLAELARMTSKEVVHWANECANQYDRACIAARNAAAEAPAELEVEVTLEDEPAPRVDAPPVY